MKWGQFFSALFVVALIMFDITTTISHAETKTTIYKVTRVSSGKTLRLRAWPSTKSRIKRKLPFNARNVIETGKSKRVGRSKWIEVRWNDSLGWVNKRYLKKTGILSLGGSNKRASYKNQSKKKVAKRAGKSRNKAYFLKSKPKRKFISRNTRSINYKQSNKRDFAPSVIQMEMPPQEFGGDRYDQTIESKASEMKTSFSANRSITPTVKKN